MPTYCYEKPDGSIIEKTMTIAEMEDFDKNPVVDGETLKRRVDVEMQGHSNVNDLWRNPILSEGAGCHPTQIDEMKKHAAKHGVNTEYTKDGRAVFTSRAQRAAHLKAFNMHDRNGGYGD
tara:strand:- start:118 stop:477 length:360 start_codon:yes stop_codon:yes gene_type:complete